MARLCSDMQYELGGRALYADQADSYDDGEETEVEYGSLSALAPVHSAPPERAHQPHPHHRVRVTRTPASTAPSRSLSLSSLPTLLDSSLYASMPSGLLLEDESVRRSKSFAAPRRRDSRITSSSSSNGDEREGPPTYRAAVSYWRHVLRRFRDGLDAVL